MILKYQWAVPPWSEIVGNVIDMRGFEALITGAADVLNTV
jgi:hypothetical protein